MLRLKVGGGGLDGAALAKAEAALKSLSSNFGEWLQDEITKLEAARAEVKANGAAPDRIKALYLRAHDLKGLGATYEFPLVGRIAASLCKLLDDDVAAQGAPIMKLVDAHIDTIKAVVRDGVKSESHPVGAALAGELESQVARHRPESAA